MSENEVLVRVQATPNPNAWKFILNKTVITDGKATYADKEEAKTNALASALFEIPDIRQVHYFQNVITITHNFDAEVERLQEAVISVIQTRMAIHNPDFNQKVDLKAEARKNMPEDLLKIEEILDRTIRPGLQGDGGDIAIIKKEGNQLFVQYEGACGTCPSSTSGTLMAIEGILRDEYSPDIEVVPM